jgi:hypothetical protein
VAADFVRLTVVRTELDAEMVERLLATDGIVAFRQVTNVGAGSFDGVGRGQHEILVRPEHLERARELIDEGS